MQIIGIYQCPKCKFVSGTFAPLYPNKLSLFIHAVDCHNTKSIPIELNYNKIYNIVPMNTKYFMQTNL